MSGDGNGDAWPVDEEMLEAEQCQWVGKPVVSVLAHAASLKKKSDKLWMLSQGGGGPTMSKVFT